MLVAASSSARSGRPPQRGQRQREAQREPQRQRRHAHEHVVAEVVGQPRQRVGEAAVHLALLRAASSAVDPLGDLARRLHQLAHVGVLVLDQRRRRPSAITAPAAQHGDAVGKAQRLQHVVGDHDAW